MKVAMLIRDAEYRDALINMMSLSDRDILIEIATAGAPLRDCIIITDISPSEIDPSSLRGIRKRTLFLSASHPSDEEDSSGCRIVFKYTCLTDIMAELSLLYSEWTGNTAVIRSRARIIAAASETDSQSGARCRRLAGQIIYSRGGSILILPLGYINDYRTGASDDDGAWFRRLMYMIEEGRAYPPDSFTYKDSYGVTYLRLPPGINPLTGLDEKYLRSLITSLGRCFDTLILDIGTTYSSINLRLMSWADNVLYFGTGRRISDPEAFTGTAGASVINSSDPQEEARGIDDFVAEMYGRNEEKRSDPAIQK